MAEKKEISVLESDFRNESHAHWQHAEVCRILTEKNSENHLSFFPWGFPDNFSNSCLISLETLPHSKGGAPDSTARSNTHKDLCMKLK